VILPDVNLLLYAYDAHSPFHATSKTWWSKCYVSDFDTEVRKLEIRATEKKTRKDA
jgi:predicted nucleic acid-binding protein